MRRTITFVLILGVLAGGGFGAVSAWRLYESAPPVIEWVNPPKAIGRKAQLGLKVTDSGAGIAKLTVTIEQAATPPVVKTVLEETVVAGPDGQPPKSWEKVVEFDPRELGIRDGDVKLVVTATDHSRRNGGQGNTATAEPLTLAARLRPPQVELLSDQHNIEFGGSMMVAYRVGASAVEDGVRVGARTFPGYPSPADSAVHICLFALSFREPEGADPTVFARDEIGNEAEVRFNYKVMPRKYPDEEVQLKPEWIQAVRDRFALPPSLDDTAAFLEVNSKLRVQNHETLAKVLEKTAPEAYWSGAFGRMNGKPVSRFAETRHYLWQGKEIDQQVHLGVDIAALQNFPVPAAGAGVVIHASDLGIYGNCVIIDHGMGLATLYGHLSSMSVAEGDKVTQNQIVGRTGTTGLAFGDHLHFGMYVHGVAVDPKDWWDPLFIRKRIEPKLAAWRSGGANVAAQAAAAAIATMPSEGAAAAPGGGAEAVAPSRSTHGSGKHGKHTR
ncbi:MAG: M23 family metallopeptidase [bacterium]